MQLTPEQTKLLNKIEDITTKNHELLDKIILSMSSIFIGIIVGFSKDINSLIVKVPMKVAMLLVLFFFVAAIVLTITGYKVAAFEGKYTQENIYHQQQIHNITKLTKLADIIEHCALLSFIYGLFSIFMFFIVLFFPDLV